MNDIYSLKCDVCYSYFESEDILISHYLEACHSQQQMFIKIRNNKIREILGLKIFEGNQIESISKNDYYNINESLFLTNNKNKVNHDSNKNKDNIYYHNNNKYIDINEINFNDQKQFENINKPIENASCFRLFSENKNKTIQIKQENNNELNNKSDKSIEIFLKNIKRKCEICFEHVDPNYSEYIEHLKQNHNFYLVVQSIKDKFITDCIMNQNKNWIKQCDICDEKISFNVFDYIDHIRNDHKIFLNKTLIKYVKDKYVLSVILEKDYYNLASQIIVCDLCGEEIFDYKDFNEHKANHKKNKNSCYASVSMGSNSKASKVWKININSFDNLKLNGAKNSNFFNENGIIIENNCNFSRDSLKENNPNMTNNNDLKKKSEEILNEFYSEKKYNKEDYFRDLEEEYLKENKLNNYLDKNRNNKIKIEATSRTDYLKLLKNKVIYYNLLLRNIKESYKIEMQEREKLKKEMKDLMLSKICVPVGEINNKQIKAEYLKNSIYTKIQNFKDIKLEYDRDYAKLLEENFVINLKKYENIIKENENEFQYISKKLEEKDKKQMMNSIKIQEVENKAQEEFLSKNSLVHKPKEWIDQKENLLVVVELKSSSAEFTTISKMFSDSLKFEIKKISRIQNQKLWNSFCFNKLNLNVNANKNDKHKLLFYGSKVLKPEKIYGAKAEGFDMKIATIGAYGRALYFHQNAKSAHPQRFEVSGLNFLLVANVFVGDFKKVEVGYSFMKVPPIKDKVRNIRFDSVLSPDGKFMIYNKFRAYPAYVIEY